MNLCTHHPKKTKHENWFEKASVGLAFRGHRLSIFIFFNGIWPLRSEPPPPLPVNGLLPNGPPIGLKSLAQVRLGEQQTNVLWNMLDFNRKYALSGGIVKLFYSTLYMLFVKILSTLLKKFSYGDFRTIFYFLNGLRVRPPPPITANCR